MPLLPHIQNQRCNKILKRKSLESQIQKPAI